MQATSQPSSRPLQRHRAVLLATIGWVLSALAAAAYAGEGAETKGFAALEGIEPEKMASARAGDGSGPGWVNVQSIQKMEANVNNPTFTVGNDIVTGDVTFANGAIGNYHGVGVFNVITGNANAVNSAVGISIYMTE